MEEKAVTCPSCGSHRNWKDGIRYASKGENQRYLCRECYCRFTFPWKLADLKVILSFPG